MNISALIAQRLKAVGMLAAAERAAKRAGVRLADCLVPGDEKPTAAHVEVWRALSAEGVSDDQIATMCDWPLATVRRAVRPDQPKAPSLSKGDVEAATRSAMAPLEARLAKLTKDTRLVAAAAVREATEPLREQIANLKRQVMVAKRVANSAAVNPVAHLARYGRAGELVREMCAAACVPVEDLLGGRRLAHVSACRGAIIERLSSGDLGDGQTRQGWSSPAIGALLCLDHSTVLYHLAKTGKAAA